MARSVDGFGTDDEGVGRRERDECEPHREPRPQHPLQRRRRCTLARPEPFALVPRPERHVEVPLVCHAQQGAVGLLCRQLQCQLVGQHHGAHALADVWRKEWQELGQAPLHQYALPLHLYRRLLRDGLTPRQLHLQRADEEPGGLLPPHIPHSPCPKAGWAAGRSCASMAPVMAIMSG